MKTKLFIMETEIENKPLSTEVKNDNRCPDFDEDCKEVKDHVACYLGLWGCGVAKGYCPFIHPEN